MKKHDVSNIRSVVTKNPSTNAVTEVPRTTTPMVASSPTSGQTGMEHPYNGTPTNNTPYNLMEIIKGKIK